MLEAIERCEAIAGRELQWDLSNESRVGDHRWWISDLAPFQRDYPEWESPTESMRSSGDLRAERRAMAYGALSSHSQALKLSVVIPAHNEAESIGETVRAPSASSSVPGSTMRSS